MNRYQKIEFLKSALKGKANLLSTFTDPKLAIEIWTQDPTDQKMAWCKETGERHPKATIETWNRSGPGNRVMMIMDPHTEWSSSSDSTIENQGQY